MMGYKEEDPAASPGSVARDDDGIHEIIGIEFLVSPKNRLKKGAKKTWHPFVFRSALAAYQRSRFPPGPRPPPPRERCSIGFASLTVNERPPMSEPLSAVIAAFASESEDISTKPNPRDCPVNLSAMIFAEATVPCAPNKSLNCCSVAE